jgi:hypothetical protein
MQTQIKNHDKYRLVAVRWNGTEAVIISDLSIARAESVKANLVDSRAFADIRIEPAPKSE